MADHHTEAALILLKSWRTILGMQVKAANEGNIQKLESLIQQSTKIQQQLQKLLFCTPLVLHERKIADTIRDLHQEQGSIIESLKGQTEELAREIGTLRRNKSSLGGYKQKKDSPPRFMSKLT